MSEPMLAIDHVELIHNPGRSDEVVALRDLNLTVPQGEFVTVVGSNGAGKSSTIQIISGAATPTRGSVRIAGRDVTRWPDYRRAGLVARVFDDPRIGTAPDLSIEDNLALAAQRGKRRTLRRSLTPRLRADLASRVEVLGLGLEHRLHDRVGLLSAGQRQSLTMVMAALTTPSVLLLDEHLAALDPATAARVLTLTVELQREMGCSTVMVTHNMAHAIETGDRLLVMSRGRIIADISGEPKRTLDSSGVIDLITSSGGAVSDRSLITEELSA